MRRVTFLTTQPKITGQIRDICQSLSDHPPQMVKLVPFPGCETDSFANLTAQIERFGGQAVAGWRILVWPRVLLLAEPHQIWQSPKDELIDITPSHDRVAETMFVPDASVAQGSASQRLPLVRNVDLDIWINMVQMGQDHTDLGLDAFLRVVRKFAKPQDPCYCGSGRQLRKCHPFPK